jgi:hypothetical protein
VVPEDIGVVSVIATHDPVGERREIIGRAAE